MQAGLRPFTRSAVSRTGRFPAKGVVKVAKPKRVATFILREDSREIEVWLVGVPIPAVLFGLDQSKIIMKLPAAPSFMCEGCILAGGLSRRMGRDKTRLRLGGRTVLGQIRATARQLRHPV